MYCDHEVSVAGGYHTGVLLNLFWNANDSKTRGLSRKINNIPYDPASLIHSVCCLISAEVRHSLRVVYIPGSVTTW